MHYRSQRALFGVLAVMGLVGAPRLAADEGMWLFNKAPVKALKEKYNFTPTAEWLEHIQKSAVRFNSGGSGSFVSPNGLVMTNHHVGADCLQKLGDKDHNYYRDGFHARNRMEEKRCHDLELNVLMSIEDVTDQVKGAVKADMPSDQAAVARRSIMAKIEKESLDKTGLRSDVVTLYQGGQYHLYRYKKYTDVRLVFAPEQQIAFFGGDPDNFEFPRFDLDACFFRVYENGQPAKIEHSLAWSKTGVKDNDLVFVAGHPGRTNRLATMDEIEYFRDLGFPYLLQRLYRWEVLLSTYSNRSEEHARQAKEFLFSIQNSRKAREGGQAGLMDPDLIAKKQSYEQSLRKAIAADPKLAPTLKAFDRVAEAEKVRAKNIRPFTLLEGSRGAPAGFNSRLFEIARTLLRAGEERSKPNGERLREFRDSNLESMQLDLFADDPVYDELEQHTLTDGFKNLAEQLGYKHPLVQKVLDGKSPSERAAQLIKGTTLKDVAARKKLYEGGQKEVAASKDPMVLLAKLIDPEARAVRKVFESQVDEVKQQAYGQIATAKYALEGDSTYPDATFTLRLAYGVVKGYEQDGKKVPFETTFAGLYERSREHNNKQPFDLPPRWVERKDRLNLNTPFNFVCTADIIGGNSGSPVVNRKGEVVGLIFDGNIQSLVLDFAYTEDQARAVSVCSEGIIEALRKVYDAEELVAELLGK